ncbi:hypothetical protein J0S59_004637 [Salmonella enterica subsp. enterica serovar Newport]|jgi:hypothetical protein|nr:hypothetical protein [Salmonella enterica subsp. enterica serovar Newport]
MAVANTTAFEFLGKTVSFEYVRHMQLTEQSSIDFREKISGVITSVVLNLSSEPEISVNNGDFYSICDLVDFTIS